MFLTSLLPLLFILLYLRVYTYSNIECPILSAQIQLKRNDILWVRRSCLLKFRKIWVRPQGPNPGVVPTRNLIVVSCPTGSLGSTPIGNQEIFNTILYGHRPVPDFASELRILLFWLPSINHFCFIHWYRRLVNLAYFCPESSMSGLYILRGCAVAHPNGIRKLSMTYRVNTVFFYYLNVK